jgi:hypothetical protein
MLIDGTYSKVGAAFVSADLGSIRDSQIVGPSGTFIGDTDVLGVGSKFATFASTTGNTMFSLSNVACDATARSGIILANWDALVLDGQYINLSGASAHAIEVVGTGGTPQITCGYLRVEVNGATGDTDIVYLPSGCYALGGSLYGTLLVHGNGAVVRFADSTSVMDMYEIRANLAHSGGGTPKFFAGDGALYQSTAYNEIGWDSDLHPGSPLNNTVYHFANTGVSWSALTQSNLNTQIYQQSQTIKGTTLFNVIGSTLTGGGHITQGSGAPITPGNITPSAGDLYFRTDTPSTANQRIYICTTGGGSPVWVDITNGLGLLGSANTWTGANAFTNSIDINTAGQGLKVAEGSNAKQGTAVLVAGTTTVANTSVTASSRIFLTTQSHGGTIGMQYVSARTAGTSFVITSTSAADTSTVAYEIFEPG